jgi:hypothetical protein
MRLINLRRIVSYYRATSNEIYIDLDIYRIINVNPFETNFLPRPSKSLGFRPKILLRFLKLFWNFVGAYILFFTQFFSFFFKKTFYYKTIVYKKNENLGLGFSEKAIEILNYENGFDFINSWIILPWIDNTRLNNKKNIINVLELLSFQDLFLVLKLSFVAHCNFKVTDWTFQTYTSFRWFTVRLALEKVNANFYITEHYDRWAVLIDELVFHKSKLPLSSSLSLVQHGVVYSNDYCNFILPVKLYSVKNFYLYDDPSKYFFLKSVLSSRSASDSRINFFFFINKINLSPILLSSFELSILFVGNSVCLDLHLKVLKFISSNYNILVYYKPHPTQNISNIVLEQNWNLIDNKLFFPKVDFLISYPSTLVKEYAFFGISSVVHDLDFDVNLTPQFLKDVKDRINLEIKLKSRNEISNL